MLGLVRGSTKCYICELSKYGRLRRSRVGRERMGWTITTCSKQPTKSQVVVLRAILVGML